MASILVIGVGSTGLSVMERAQQFYYEFTKQSGPANAAFMFLETDQNRIPEASPNGETKIQSCYLCPDNINATLTGWQELNQRYDWLPTTADVLNTHTGAGGQPAYGRVALWSKETAVRNMIINLYGQIGGNASTNIYIVGSLTGGTGTGIFLDVAYMVRQCTTNDNIYGLFLLPNRADVGDITKEAIYQNAYSSLRSLDKFSKVDVKGTRNPRNFECVLPGGTNISSLRAPFRNVQFLTEDFSNASASLGGLTQLIQSAGFNLVLRMLDIDHAQAPFQDIINKRLVDYTMKVPNGIFTTIGMNVFQYPETLLEEYITTDLLEEGLLKRWADITNYLDQHGTPHAITTIDTKLKIDANVFVQDAIEKAIEKSQGAAMLGKSTFRAALESEIEKICSGDARYHTANYIYSLFDANSAQPNFYAAISGQMTELRDELIRSISAKVQSDSTLYQNLQIIERQIHYIAQSLQNVMQTWTKRYHLDGKANSWNNYWNELYDNRLAHGEFFYLTFGCRKLWYKEAFEGVAKLCYFNALLVGIKDMIEAMQNKQIATTLSTADGEKIPSLYSLNEIRNKVEALLDNHLSDSIVARKHNIAGQLSNTNSQITLLFNGPTYQADVKIAHGRYQTGAERLTFEKISSESLWRYLCQNEVNVLKSSMISHGLIFVQNLSLFGGSDIVNIMRNLPTTHPAYPKVNNILTKMPSVIQGDAPAMAKLIETEQFTDHDSWKLIAATPLADTDSSNLFHDAQHFHPKPTDDNYVQVRSMKNTVVIYQEYAYLGSTKNGAKTFNPVIHLAYQPHVLQNLNGQIAQKVFDDSVRLAYIDKDTLVDTDHIKIK